MENYENAVKIALFLPSELLSYLRYNGEIHKRNNISLSQYVKNKRRDNKGFHYIFLMMKINLYQLKIDL